MQLLSFLPITVSTTSRILPLRVHYRLIATDDFSCTGPLAGSFPILSLRTNKADVVVAVDKDLADRLDKSGERWRYSGKYVLLVMLWSEKVILMDVA